MNTQNNQTVTRFDVRDPADGEGTEVRFFHKRTKLASFGEDEVAREDWQEALAAFIAAKPRTVDQCQSFLLEEGDEDGEDEEAEGGSIVPEKYRRKYGASQRCGDDVAEVLSAYVTLERATKKNPDGGLDKAKLRGVAELNGIGDKLAVWEDKGLNGGLLRMNTSNVLRGMVRRGERVEIGTEVWEADPSKLEARKAARKASKKPSKKAANAKKASKAK